MSLTQTNGTSTVQSKSIRVLKLWVRPVEIERLSTQRPKMLLMDFVERRQITKVWWVDGGGCCRNHIENVKLGAIGWTQMTAQTNFGGSFRY